MKEKKDGANRESDLDEDLEEDDWGEEEDEEDFDEDEEDDSCSNSLSVPWQIEDCWDLQGRQGVMVL